jgi:hypothetical protein
MNDDHFFAVDELSERLDHALGRPAADPAGSALDEDGDWPSKG